MRMRHIVICGPCGIIIFFHVPHKRHRFPEKATEYKICFFSTNVVWNISHSRKHSARYYHSGTNAFIQSTRYCFRILIKLDFTRQIFEEYSNIKYHENPSSGSRVVPSGRRYRWTDIKKPIVDFRNSANALKNVTNCRYSCFVIITDPSDESQIWFWVFLCMLVAMNVRRCWTVHKLWYIM